MSFASAQSRVVGPVMLVAAFVLLAAFSPSHASAQVIGGSSDTSELLPPGQNTCQPIAITDIEPHVYSGVLESFDVTVSDTANSYVGILAQAGNTPIPLNFITRWAGVPSGLRIHVDTPNTEVGAGLPVTMTLLSSPAGSPTCMTVVSFDVTGQGTTASYTPATSSTPQGGAAPSSTSIPTPVVTTSPSASTGSTHGSGGNGTASTAKGSQSGAGTSTAGGGTSVVSASNAKFFSSICTGSNAYRLWFILLVIYIIIVAIVVFAEPWFLESSVIGSTAAILVPLILLLAFWYFSDTCRAASWIPVVACVIAIVGLFLAFREYELPPLLPAPSEQ